MRLYSPVEFSQVPASTLRLPQCGVEVPGSFHDLIDLADTIARSGLPPLSVRAYDDGYEVMARSVLDFLAIELLMGRNLCVLTTPGHRPIPAREAYALLPVIVEPIDAP